MLASRANQDPRTRYRFILNPYDDIACIRCPRCQAQSRARKFPLAIHINPHTFFVLNKTCRFCPSCELLVVRRCEIESLLATGLGDACPADLRNAYQVIGTLDHADWREREKLTARDMAQRVYIFDSIMDLKITGGWGR